MARAELGWSQLLGMGAVTAGSVAMGVGAGWLADHILGTLPIFLFVGLLAGIAGAVAYIVMTIRTYLS